jgi:hypothetical protein
MELTQGSREDAATLGWMIEPRWGSQAAISGWMIESRWGSRRRYEMVLVAFISFPKLAERFGNVPPS